MAITAGGLPYPVGTDFVVEGDNAIRALAEAVDIQRKPTPGTYTYGSYYSNHPNWSPLVLERVPASTRRRMSGTFTVNQPINFGANTEYTFGNIVNVSDRPALGVHRNLTISPLSTGPTYLYGWVVVAPNGNLNFAISMPVSFGTNAGLFSMDFWYDSAVAAELSDDPSTELLPALPEIEWGESTTPPGAVPGEPELGEPE